MLLCLYLSLYIYTYIYIYVCFFVLFVYVVSIYRYRAPVAAGMDCDGALDSAPGRPEELSRARAPFCIMPYIHMYIYIYLYIYIERERYTHTHRLDICYIVVSLLLV